jgi:chitinase
MRQNLIVTLLWFLPLSARCDIVVGAYLPDYRSYLDVNRTAEMLTDLILFSIAPMNMDTTTALTNACCLDSTHYQLAHDAKNHRKEMYSKKNALKIWVSIGGAGRSSGFQSILGTKSKQSGFISRMIGLCKEKNLDGIDLDHEEISSKNDYDAFMKFLTEAAKAFHAENLLLSMTTRNRPPKEVWQYVDRVNFMAYDILLPNGPKHHASYEVVTNVIDDWLKAGCPPEKIVLGIPGYGRHVHNPSQVKTYAEMVDDGLDDLSDMMWRGFSFDSWKLIRKKMDYVRRRGLAGAFLWELGHDKITENYPAGVLLSAIASVENIQDEL